MLLDLLALPSVQDIRWSLLVTSCSNDIKAIIRNLGIPLFFVRRPFLFHPKALKDLISWLKANQVDLIHAHGIQTALWGYLLKTLGTIRHYVFTEHGGGWALWGAWFLIGGRVARSADLVIANSNATATLLNQVYGVSNEKLRIVYNGIPDWSAGGTPLKRESLGYLLEHVVVGTVARLNPAKNLQLLVDSANVVLCCRPHVRFLIVGGGSDEYSLRERVRALGITDKFTITGWKENARDYYGCMDIFVSTSVRESFGNAVIEAASAGKPSVVPGIDGLSEAVIDRITGLVLPAESQITDNSVRRSTRSTIVSGQLRRPQQLSVETLVNGLLELIDNREFREHLGTAARERAKRDFSILSYRERLKAVYEEFMHNS
jgi:glycosyltransferase involved in cell wall biosynthesis